VDEVNRSRRRARGALPKETYAELIARDLTVRQIAAAVDRSPATVRHWLAAYGLRTTAAARRQGRAPTADGAARCAVHGLTPHVRRSDGALRCRACASASVSRRRRAVKRILVEEAGGACALCGYDRYLGALQFHHLDPSQKRFHLGLKGLARALDDVREEAQKCVLLCANCHAEVEGGVAQVASPQHLGRG